MTEENNAGCPRCGVQVAQEKTHQQWHQTLQKQMKKTVRREANKRHRELDNRESEPETAE